MFYLKNDDMEDLFRKAAENYEVDTQKVSDWERVHATLRAGQNLPEGGKKKKRRFIFWWFLLFPAGWMAHNTWEKNFNKRPANNAGEITYRQPGAIEMQPSGAGHGIDITSEKKSGSSSAIDQANSSSLIRDVNKTGYQDKLGNMQDKAGESSRGLSYAPALLLQKVGMRSPVLPGPTAEQYITHNPTVQALSREQAKPVPPLTKNRYFYVQGLASPDISTVKFQKISSLGYSAGLLFGYRLSKRWAVEAGALWEKKLYYTKGEYFDKSKLGQYWNNAEIYSVNGNCRMITIPVNVRYNFNAGKKSDWFITGGMSSYLMNKEYYDYTYEYYGDVHTKGYAYKENSQVWMAAINLGAGYERKIGRSLRFRIEPYFRLPVSGMGKGHLSLSSGGIFIGIGKKFH
ncbi:outer membrane beta-barrel protein [Agriterribacter sp.]|uniref:outer membrane beta-barrel protein n=1 Tax=Agriterribacter sp. TaxID=2821509 RepID=UPI002BCD6636|nr:outer membrane beta-barrel protein [Agriterribacter sp.]HRP55909.1 outer membrane beta-barrel protein [Agriterribacter sp.]